MMSRIVTALLLVASPLTAQTVVTELDGSTMITSIIPPPKNVDSLWAYVQSCSHFPAVPGELQQVVWLRGPTVATSSDHGVAGLWLPPDTIIMDLNVVDVNGVVVDTLMDVPTHELLHQLLHGPIGDDSHPYDPFYDPCALMFWQRHTDERTKRYIEHQGVTP